MMKVAYRGSIAECLGKDVWSWNLGNAIARKLSMNRDGELVNAMVD